MYKLFAQHIEIAIEEQHPVGARPAPDLVINAFSPEKKKRLKKQPKLGWADVFVPLRKHLRRQYETKCSSCLRILTNLR